VADEPNTRATPATAEHAVLRAQTECLHMALLLTLACPIVAIHAAGKPVVLLSTPIGQEGVAVLGDAVSGQEQDVCLVGALAVATCVNGPVGRGVRRCWTRCCLLCCEGPALSQGLPDVCKGQA
jgi:hypothetical protein